MRIAYLILCHKDPQHIARLVNKITDDNADAFIHIDVEVDDTQFKQLLDRNEYVYFVKDRIKPYWGGFSAVEATMKLIDLANKWSIKINKLNKVSVLNEENLPDGYSLDSSRYILILPKGYSGHKLLDYLRNMNIQCEMSFAGGVVLILSPFNLEKDFEKIYNSLEKLDLSLLADVQYQNYYSVIPKKIL